MDRALIYPGRCTSKPCLSSPNPEGTPTPRLGSKGAGPPEDGIALPEQGKGMILGTKGDTQLDTALHEGYQMKVHTAAH